MGPLSQTRHLFGVAPREGESRWRALGVAAVFFAIAAAPVATAGQDPAQPKATGKVVVVRLRPGAVTVTEQYSGQVRSRRHIEVRSLQSGYLEETPIKDGQAVKAGDILFEILPVLYRARLNAVAADKDLAQLEFDNVKKMADKHAVGLNEVKLYEAKLARARAVVDLAEAELAFTRVRAPFGGIVDIRKQQGSLVKDGETLATLSDNSQVWVYFNVPETRYLEYKAEEERERQSTEVELVLANGKKFGHVGKLGPIRADFDIGTGTIAFRADFPNPDGLLRHGQSGTVLIHRVLKDAITIPRRAIFESQGKLYVYVLDKDSVAHRREVALRNVLDDIYVVKNGVGVDDKVIVEGLQQVHDGEKVKDADRDPKE